MEYITIDNYMQTYLGDVKAYIFIAKVKDILPIYYVAVRGRDEVEGAVQRVLNRRRINSIKDFILDGNMFFNTFILNWTDENYSLIVNESDIKIPIISGGAQVIDGQHRLEGLKKAIEENEDIGEEPIIIIMTEKMSTKAAAKIFLNINTEQKPVPKSLVYDLFGEVKDKNSYIVRATDIANELNDNPDSPYYQCIKKPGSAQGIGKVDLSTVVNSLKEYTGDEGVFHQYHFDDYEIQYKIISNFFSVIKSFYSKEGCWLKNANPFMSNAGFYSGIKFLCEDLVDKCVEKKSFEQSTISNLLNLDEVGLLYREDIKNMQGKEQRNEIYKYLKNSLLREVPDQDEYKF
ncbi:MAG: DGQHR domain-containing protein [Lachnospiraceae bacterium]|nr:DGQHR domain-containing protein [Lachnospiraceae bacterium]